MIDNLQNSNAALYGKGVSTTLAFHASEPIFLRHHWKRLCSNSAVLGIDISAHTESSAKDKLARAIAASGLRDGRARITILDERPSELWPFRQVAQPKSSFSILVNEHHVLPKFFRLTVSPFPINSRSPLAGIKSCNYLEPIMSLDEAKGRGFHEAIRVNERGIVTSACMANVFWLKGGELFTPSLTTGCLAGTTREFVIENIDCREVEVGIEALADAEAIFLTSAGIGVVPVAEFEAKRLKKIDHPILHLLPY